MVRADFRIERRSLQEAANTACDFLIPRHSETELTSLRQRIPTGCHVYRKALDEKPDAEGIAHSHERFWSNEAILTDETGMANLPKSLDLILARVLVRLRWSRTTSSMRFYKHAIPSESKI
jgi:hypothetical protein